jgi:hypothetical protein
MKQTILRSPMCSVCGAPGAKRGNKRGITRPLNYACKTKGCPHSKPTELSKFEGISTMEAYGRAISRPT